MPVPPINPPIIPPRPQQMRSSAARRVLVGLTDQLAIQTGQAEAPGAGKARLNVTLLRALDAWERDADAPIAQKLPRWLKDAHKQAIKELVAWHIARGLPTPDDATDPGDASDRDRVSLAPEMVASTPPETPFERTVEYLKCRRSIVYFVDSYCHLHHKVRGVIPFRLWRWQAWLLYRWASTDLSIMLKARQIGVSELAAAVAFHLIRFHDTKKAIFLSKGKNEAQELLARARVSADFLPDWLTPGDIECIDACVFGTRNTETLALVHRDAERRPHPSEITSLAATENAGRSFTAALVVLDEFAHMLWGNTIWGAIKATAGGGGKILAISTANGVGNVFHRIWDAAARGANSFEPIFLSWRRHPDRSAEWYAREKRDAEAEGPRALALFHQEFPADPVEAFIQSGLPVFAADMLKLHKDRIQAEIATRAAAGVELATWPSVDGVTIYEEPAPGFEYLIGADVAEGVAHGDFDAATVICRQTGREVASVHGHFTYEVYAAILDELGYRYNRALLAVERNSIGQSVLLALTSGLAHERWHADHQRVSYPKLYHYKPDLVPGRAQDARPGWFSDVRSKPLAVSSLNRALREGAFLPRDAAFLDEALVFAWNEDGKGCGAPEGYHDDRVACRYIAVHLLVQPDHIALALAYATRLRELVDGQVASRRGGSGATPTPTPAEPAPAEVK